MTETESLQAAIDALKQERVAYYRALTTEGAEVIQRVTRIVLDTRDQITDELAETLDLRARLEVAERHKHTDACLEYAAKTGRAFCIADCADGRAALAREETPRE